MSITPSPNMTKSGNLTMALSYVPPSPRSHCGGSVVGGSSGSSSSSSDGGIHPNVRCGSRFDILLSGGGGSARRKLLRSGRQTYATAVAPHHAEMHTSASGETTSQFAVASPPAAVGTPCAIPTPETSRKLRPQPFSHVLVCDFEATCESGSVHYPHEIIEFPVIVLDTATLRVVAEFHEYVRPVANPVLTTFCTDLTGITQATVNAADPLPIVVAKFERWLQDTVYPLCRAWREEHGIAALSSSLRRSEQKQFVYDEHTLEAAACQAEEAMICFATDGPWDMRRFMHACSVLRDGVAFPPLFYRFVNVRHCYTEHFRGKQVKLTHMLRRLNMGFEGQRHSGIDDTRNITRVLAELFARGYRISHVSCIKYAHRGDALLAANAAVREILEEYGDTEKRPARKPHDRPRKNRSHGS